jgi:hypothetical protein
MNQNKMLTSPEQFRLVLIVLSLTVISGIGDAHGFIHSAKVWHAGRWVWPEVAQSALGFAFGMSMYWVAVRYYQQLGISLAETQTIFWFAVTLIGVAVVSGKFIHWAWIDQGVALAVLAGIGWLLVRTGG